MRARRIHLNLNPAKDDERRVLEYLLLSEKSYSKAIVTAVNGYLDACEKDRNDNALIQEIVRAVREASPRVALTPSEGEILSPVDDDDMNDRVSPLDFLAALESSTGFGT